MIWCTMPGNARFDPKEPSRSGWVLQDAVLTAAEISRVTHPPLLVFANAYESGATTPWQTSAIYDQQAFGIGSAFLLAGTQNYLGTFYAIHDAQSAEFAAEFYRHLLQGASVGDALAAARQQIRQQGDMHDLLWASYLHYGNPTFRVLPPPADARAVPNMPPPPAEPAPIATPPAAQEVSDDDVPHEPPPGFLLRHTLHGHESWMGGMAWSADGQTLASAAGDRTIRLWDTTALVKTSLTPVRT